MTESKENDELYEKIILELKGHDRKVMKSYMTFIKMAATFLEIEHSQLYVQVFSQYICIDNVNS